MAKFQQQSIPGYSLVPSGCFGLCGSGPVVCIMPGHILYEHVHPNDVTFIIESHLLPESS